MIVAMILMSSAVASEELPDAELLEFLADWETEDGQWIDPTTLEQSMQQIEATSKEVAPYD
ncbi:MAG: hypothetical protein OQL27_07675 [Sedimenticola sp.]|nr:hypothetical protein [Sedimenticola sp.]